MTLTRDLKQRVWYLAAGTGLLLLVGIVYAWSILSAPLAEAFGWNSQDLSLNFTVMMSFFCLSGILGGVLCARTGSPKLSLLLAAACSLGGFLSTAYCTGGQLFRLYLFYGVLVGAGAGFAYNAVIGCVSAWFPEKRGFASGVLLMGFGSSTLLLGGGASALMEAGTLSWQSVYLAIGVLLCLGLVLGSLVLRHPGPGAALPAPAATEKAAESLSTGKMVQTGAFWMFFLFAVAGGGIGSGVIAHAGPIAASSGVAGATAVYVGLLSVSNGVGRVIFGMLYDRLGRKAPMLLAVVFFGSALALMACSLQVQIPALVVPAYLLIGASYGAVPTMAAAYTAARFGPKFYSTNFSVMNLTLMCSSFSSVVSGTLYMASGTYLSSLGFYAALCGCMAVMCLLLNGGRRK